ncbi:CD3337/EF1877 family mobilome membrane protein [Shouchella miscanthi]|uniref:Uncharacterized protein n=1 Tax=Shouchella miscanthi TaxID=2598861 RepID=A0ABU6NJ07_9BACI|nr:hypothetical protein [Shouchella miscanthi]
MLSLSRTADGLEARENLARDEVEDIGNHAMSQDNVWNSVGVSILSIAFVLLLGIPVLLLALVNLLLELLVLILAIAIPLAFLVSLLPAFANSGWGALQKLLSVFIMKIFVGFLLLLTFVIVVVMDELIPPTTPGMYMLNLILVSVVLFLMILKRDKIIQTISGGRVASVDAGVSQRAYNSGVKAPASFATRMAKKGAIGAVGVAGYGVAKLRERNQQRKAQKPEGTENGEQTNKDGMGKETQNTKPSLLQRFKNGKRSKQGELENQNQTKEKGSKETKNDKSVPPTNLNEYREKRNAERNKGNGNRKEFESKEEKNSIPYQKASGDGTNKRSRVRTPQQEKNFREYNGKKRPTKWESNKQLRSTQAEKEAIKNRLGGKKPKIQRAPSLQTNRGKRIKQSSLAHKEASATRDLKQRRIREADRKPKLNQNKQTRKPKLNRNNPIKQPKRATSTRKRSSQSAQTGKTRRKIAGKIATQTAHAYASSKARRVRR